MLRFPACRRLTAALNPRIRPCSMQKANTYVGAVMHEDQQQQDQSLPAAEKSHDHRCQQVVHYHDRTKHSFRGYARGPPFLDWANQPSPWRVFQGAPSVTLPLEEEDNKKHAQQHKLVVPSTPYPLLYAAPATKHPASVTQGNELVVPTMPLNVGTISSFLYHSLALSAWKKHGSSQWSLRVNPSSGNLHPTEGYLLLPEVPTLFDRPSVAHYRPEDHALEARCLFDDHHSWKQLTSWALGSGESAKGAKEEDWVFFAALTSIHWREAWKYGERAFRYCNHDIGHALGAYRMAAAMLGWRLHVLDNIIDDQLSQLLGLNRKKDFLTNEEEEPALLAVVLPQSRSFDRRIERIPEEILISIAQRSTWSGHAAPLSKTHINWSIISETAMATKKDTIPPITSVVQTDPALFEMPPDYTSSMTKYTASQIIRQRRSALDFDGQTTITSGQFYGILSRVVPALTPVPWDTMPLWTDGDQPTNVKIHLCLFVHRVEGIVPGLYMLLRDATQLDILKSYMRHENENVQYLWIKPPDAPENLPIYCLAPGSFQDTASKVSCLQEIAGDSCFALGMIAEFEDTILGSGPCAYRRLFWEAGLIGQVLYLEAEAQGVRATGIGCYFDDAVHSIFGIGDHKYQSLYHFTIGGPIEDPRLRTLKAYMPIE